jgi:hypothetical protein
MVSFDLSLKHDDGDKALQKQVRGMQTNMKLLISMNMGNTSRYRVDEHNPLVLMQYGKTSLGYILKLT